MTLFSPVILYSHTFDDFRVRVLIGSVATLLATSYEQPVTKLQTTKSIVYWRVQTKYGVRMQMRKYSGGLRKGAERENTGGTAKSEQSKAKEEATIYTCSTI